MIHIDIDTIDKWKQQRGGYRREASGFRASSLGFWIEGLGFTRFKAWGFKVDLDNVPGLKSARTRIREIGGPIVLISFKGEGLGSVPQVATSQSAARSA